MDRRLSMALAVAAWTALASGLCAANVYVSPNGRTFSSPEGVDVSVSNWPSEEPVLNGILQAKSRAQKDKELEVSCKAMGRPFYQKRLPVPAGRGVRADVFLPLNEFFFYGQATVSLRGTDFCETWSSLSRNYHSGPADAPLCRPMKPDVFDGMTWRHLCGLSTVRMEARLWEELPEASKTALLEWTELGGNLEIEGTPSQPVAKGRPPLSFSPAEGDGRYGRGRLKVAEKFSSEAGQRSVLEEHAGFNPSPSWEVATMRPQVFVPALVVFGLLIGPGTILWCRRRGRPALALLLIPAISAVSCASLLALSLLNDGVRPKVCRQSVAYLDQTKGKAYVQEIIGVEAPMGLGSPVDFPEDAIVVIPGVASDVSRGCCFASRGRLLLDSFVLPRIPTFFGLAKYGSRRERLEVREGADSLRVTNGLGAAVRELLVRDSKGLFWGADFVQAGQEAELSRRQPKEMYGGFYALRLSDSSLKKEAVLGLRCYQAYLDSDVFGERGVDSDRLVGDNYHLLVGKY